MVTPDLLEFITERRKRGFSDESTQLALTTHGGWETTDVREALVKLTEPTETTDNPVNKSFLEADSPKNSSTEAPFETVVTKTETTKELSAEKEAVEQFISSEDLLSKINEGASTLEIDTGSHADAPLAEKNEVVAAADDASIKEVIEEVVEVSTDLSELNIIADSVEQIHEQEFEIVDPEKETKESKVTEVAKTEKVKEKGEKPSKRPLAQFSNLKKSPVLTQTPQTKQSKKPQKEEVFTTNKQTVEARKPEVPTEINKESLKASNPAKNLNKSVISNEPPQPSRDKITEQKAVSEKKSKGEVKDFHEKKETSVISQDTSRKETKEKFNSTISEKEQVKTEVKPLKQSNLTEIESTNSTKKDTEVLKEKSLGKFWSRKKKPAKTSAIIEPKEEHIVKVSNTPPTKKDITSTAEIIEAPKLTKKKVTKKIVQEVHIPKVTITSKSPPKKVTRKTIKKALEGSNTSVEDDTYHKLPLSYYDTSIESEDKSAKGFSGTGFIVFAILFILFLLVLGGGVFGYFYLKNSQTSIPVEILDPIVTEPENIVDSSDTPSLTDLVQQISEEIQATQDAETLPETSEAGANEDGEPTTGTVDQTPSDEEIEEEPEVGIVITE